MRHFVILLLLLILFFWRFSTIKTPNYSNGTQIRITATLKTAPQVSGGTQKFSLSGIKITTWKYPEYQYGDRLIVSGVVKNNSLEMPGIEKREAGSPYRVNEMRDAGNGISDIGYLIFELRNQIDKKFRKNLPEPEASLLSGITLGLKSNLPKDFYYNLQKTGTMHIIVASGMNVALVSGTITTFLLWFFSRKKAVILSIILIWFYVELAGGDVPVVRAGIMGSVVLLAQFFGREPDVLNALGVAVAIIVFINPASLNDIGFQLSFAATLGIVMLSKKLSSLLSRLPERVRNDLGQTLSAQLFTLPIMLLNFGYYSWISVPVNLLVAWPLVWILRLGLVAGFVGILFAPLGYLICLFILPLLSYFVRVVELFGK